MAPEAATLVTHRRSGGRTVATSLSRSIVAADDAPIIVAHRSSGSALIAVSESHTLYGYAPIGGVQAPSTLAVADSTVALTIDAPTLILGDALEVADSLVALAIDSPALIQANTLAVQDLLTALALSSPTLELPPDIMEGFDYRSELPRVYLNTARSNTPSNGDTWLVQSGESVQDAVNAAVPGDTIYVDDGAIWDANLTIPTGASGGIAGEWRTIVTAGGCTPEGVRMTPTDAATYNIPRIRGTFTAPIIQFASGATKWRLIGLELTVKSDVTTAYGLVDIGTGSETDVDDLPADIILDRCWIHGHPTLDARHGVELNGARCAIIDSTISDMHSVFDSQAIICWNSPGPLKIVNCRLEAAAEGINFGGATVGIAGQLPRDIEIRRNHIVKDPSWLGTWLIKNGIEFKMGERTLVEGNVIENVYPDGQVGSGIVAWSVSQYGDDAAWVKTSDLTIRHNLFRNIAAWVQLDGNGVGYPNPGLPFERVTVRNNAVIGLSNVGNPGTGHIVKLAGGNIPGLTIRHNTVFTPNGSTLYFVGTDVHPDFNISDNLTGGGSLHVFASDGNGEAAWLLHTSGAREFLGNVIVGADAGSYPAGNHYPATFSDVGLVGGGSAATDVDALLADLALDVTSPYKGTATDDTDPGADIAAVAAAIAGVV